MARVEATSGYAGTHDFAVGFNTIHQPIRQFPGRHLACTLASPADRRVERARLRLVVVRPRAAEELALPPVKIHCSILAEDAIKAAVDDYRAKHAN